MDEYIIRPFDTRTLLNVALIITVPEISASAKFVPLNATVPSVSPFKFIVGPAMNRPIRLSDSIAYELLPLPGLYVFDIAILMGPPPVRFKKYVLILSMMHPLKSAPLTSIWFAETVLLLL